MVWKLVPVLCCLRPFYDGNSDLILIFFACCLTFYVSWKLQIKLKLGLQTSLGIWRTQRQAQNWWGFVWFLSVERWVAGCKGVRSTDGVCPGDQPLALYQSWAGTKMQKEVEEQCLQSREGKGSVTKSLWKNHSHFDKEHSIASNYALPHSISSPRACITDSYSTCIGDGKKEKHLRAL